jgi:hypothetical protein
MIYNIDSNIFSHILVLEDITYIYISLDVLKIEYIQKKVKPSYREAHIILFFEIYIVVSIHLLQQTWNCNDMIESITCNKIYKAIKASFI